MLGVSEDKAMTIVPKSLEAASGSGIAIKGLFRIRVKNRHNLTSQTKASDSGTHSNWPRPILISCPWDRRIILAGRKEKLSAVEGMERYFLQPDICLEE